MADVAAGPGPEGAAYWSRDLSEEDHPPVFVPGVSAERSFRARPLLKGRKAEGKVEAPAAAAAASVSMDAPGSPAEAAGQQIPDKGEIKSASLKDLCPEDKRRIANLIKELARVSEEKEVTEERLKAEQESFEKKIRQLEEQNELIIKEREALQQQYRECQELLSLYQKYLSEQQEKLTHSLSELEAAKQKEQQMSSHRELGQPLPSLELDGSYLGIARPQTLYKNNRVACGNPSPISADPTYRNSHVRGAAIHDNQQEERNKFLLETGAHGKFNNMVSPAKPKAAPHVRRTAAVDQSHNACPLQVCFFNPKPGSSDHDSFQNGCHIPKRHSGPCCGSFPDYSHMPGATGLNGSLESGLKEAEYGKRLSEERRKQLLLQKIELEIEKERLQNLLAKQEAKLLLQQQRLQQSRLDYNRFKGRTPNSEELLIDEMLMRPGGLAPVMNGSSGGLSPATVVPPVAGRVPHLPVPRTGDSLLSQAQLWRLPFQDAASIRERLQSVREQRREQFGEEERRLQRPQGRWSTLGGTRKETPRTRGERTPGCRKDAATSPGLAGSRRELVTTATSPIQRDTSRYEASLLELVEAMSPGLQPPNSGSRSYVEASRNKPGWSRSFPSAQNGAADLEESRILEEIFFI